MGGPTEKSTQSKRDESQATAVCPEPGSGIARNAGMLSPNTIQR